VWCWWAASGRGLGIAAGSSNQSLERIGFVVPEKYIDRITQYCELEGVDIPLGFGRNSPSRFVAIDLDKAPPRLIALTWFKHADLVHYLRTNGKGRRFRLLDFKDREELIFEGQGSLEKGNAF